MPKYALEYRKAYLDGRLSKQDLVRRILEKANKHERGEHLVLRGTKALVELSRERGLEFIGIDDIRLRSGIRPQQSATAGLWVWLSKGADLVEKRRGSRAYRIRAEYHDTFQQLIGGQLYADVAQPPRYSILNLQGLGKDVWAGIDPQAYVHRERSAWAG